MLERLRARHCAFVSTNWSTDWISDEPWFDSRNRQGVISALTLFKSAPRSTWTWEAVAILSGVKRPGVQADQSTQSDTQKDIKKEWNYTSSAPHDFLVCAGIRS